MPHSHAIDLNKNCLSWSLWQCSPYPRPWSNKSYFTVLEHPSPEDLCFAIITEQIIPWLFVLFHNFKGAAGTLRKKKKRVAHHAWDMKRVSRLKCFSYMYLLWQKPLIVWPCSILQITQGTTCLFLADFDADVLQLATVFHSCIHCYFHCCYNTVHFLFKILPSDLRITYGFHWFLW